MTSFIEKLKAKLHFHHSTSPILAQRDEFLAVNSSTPIENKSHFTPEVVGAAAAFEAVRAFENHEINQGSKPTHAKARETVGDLAESYALKLIGEKDLPFPSLEAKENFAALAQKVAKKDAKRALRESGVYGHHEMEVADGDENGGHTLH